MKKSRIMLILGICAIAAAMALAFLAFRSAKQEEEYRNAENRKILLSECKMIAGLCLDVLKKEGENLCAAISRSDATPKSLMRLQEKNPFIRQIFATDISGNPVFPEKNNPFFKIFNSLFYEQLSISVEKNESGDPSDQEKNKNGNGAKFQSRFGMSLSSGKSGWIPWFTENRLRPIVWAKNLKTTSVIGAELETMVLLSRVIPALSQNVPEYFSIELTDSQEKTIHRINFDTMENSEAKKKIPDAIIPVSQDMVPGWQIRGYLNKNAAGANRSFVLFNILQIVSLIFIFAASGALIFWFVRREIELAGQKTSFVANVSHELKTPLTSIRMYSEMLLHNKDKITEEKQAQYLSVIISESERLSRLISNVLSFSRMESGQKKYSPSEFSLNEFLDEICEIYRPALLAKGINLEIRNNDTAASVFIDRDALVQVMENLISNAAKYASTGKELTIELEKNNSQILIKVMDRGPGIPSASETKIFNKFYRCDNSLTAETRGNGLGLTIARGMMRDQSGDLTYMPREGGGSIFCIMIKEKGNPVK